MSHRDCVSTYASPRNSNVHEAGEERLDKGTPERKMSNSELFNFRDIVYVVVK